MCSWIICQIDICERANPKQVFLNYEYNFFFVKVHLRILTKNLWFPKEGNFKHTINISEKGDSFSI